MGITYELKCICLNCGEGFKTHIPFGVMASEISTPNYRIYFNNETVKCNFCGCNNVKKSHTPKEE